ncbi:hypothetical protein BJ742DRAFT_541161 [Cladochytrium replicatum]|nr:hypothetical protein BJ742DRAFT_541161 [Cladochytrium replicatum]
MATDTATAIVTIVIIYFLLRFVFGSAPRPSQQSAQTNRPASSNQQALLQQNQRLLEASRANPAFRRKVDQVLEMFPDFAPAHARVVIEVDLIRNNGNVDATCESILGGRLVAPPPPAPSPVATSTGTKKAYAVPPPTGLDITKPLEPAPRRLWAPTPEERSAHFKQQRDFMLKQAQYNFLRSAGASKSSPSASSSSQPKID